MGKVRVAGFAVSLDGFSAGTDQSLEFPLGRRGPEIFQWFFGTKTFQSMFGKGGGSEGVDEKYAFRSMDGFGAFILGRNMFGPIRGDWPDDQWKGCGATIRPITRRPSSSPIIRATRSRWRAARPSISSPTASSRR